MWCDIPGVGTLKPNQTRVLPAVFVVVMFDSRFTATATDVAVLRCCQSALTGRHTTTYTSTRYYAITLVH